MNLVTPGLFMFHFAVKQYFLISSLDRLQYKYIVYSCSMLDDPNYCEHNFLLKEDSF